MLARVLALVQYYGSADEWALLLPKPLRAHQHLHRPPLGGKTPSSIGQMLRLRMRSWELWHLRQQQIQLEWLRPRTFDSAKNGLSRQH